jgi:hypothetical protein
VHTTSGVRLERANTAERLRHVITNANGGVSPMSKVYEAKQGGRPRIQTMTAVSLVIISMVVACWALVTVANATQVPSSDFISPPTTPLSTEGVQTMFVNVAAVFRGGLAVGVRGYLQTSSGTPIAVALVYMTYFDAAYRAQAATTEHNGYFEALFPINWTGWLPLTVTYFGDDQHQGLRQFSASMEEILNFHRQSSGKVSVRLSPATTEFVDQSIERQAKARHEGVRLCSTIRSTLISMNPRRILVLRSLFGNNRCERLFENSQ